MIFRVSLIFAIAITAATVFMLYKTQANAKKIGENNCKLGILGSLSPKEKQTISYHNEKYELVLQDYIILYAEYPNGSIITSRSGKK